MHNSAKQCNVYADELILFNYISYECLSTVVHRSICSFNQPTNFWTTINYLSDLSSKLAVITLHFRSKIFVVTSCLSSSSQTTLGKLVGHLDFLLNLTFSNKLITTYWTQCGRCQSKSDVETLKAYIDLDWPVSPLRSRITWLVSFAMDMKVKID